MLRITACLLMMAGLLPNAAVVAQELRFQAEILPDGTLDVRPADGTAGMMFDDSVVGTGPDDQVLLWTDEAGAIKGILSSQEQAANLPLMPGDTLQTYATAGFNPFGALLPSEEEIQQLMEDLAQRLFEQAKEQACGFSPLPETVTPSVSISFGALFSGTAALEATWTSEALCGSSN